MGSSSTPSVKRAFVVGCRRSGTTWVTMLLAHDPHVVGVQQSSFFYRLGYLLRFLDEEVEYGRHVLTSGGDPEAAGLQRRAVRDVIPKSNFDEHLRPLAEEVYDRLAGCGDATVAVVDHQPENVRSPDHILAIFPDAYFLHLVRDPRSVYSSYVQSARTWAEPRNFTTDPVEFAEEWTADVRAGHAIAEATDRCLEVRYERLLEDGEGELRRIQEFLGLETDNEERRSALEACRIDRVRASGHGPEGYFRSGRASGWRDELPRSRVAIVEHCCRELMDELGYARRFATSARKPLALRLHELKKRLSAGVRRWARNGSG